MSTIQVVNVNFESTANNQLVYSSNSLTIRTGGSTAAFTNINSNGVSFNIPTKLNLGSASGYDFGNLAIIEIDATQNTYQQIVIQNANSGVNASGDLVITNDTGNDSVGFIDLGINSSTYSNALFNIGTAGDGYLYTSNGALTVGTASAKDIVFHSNGTVTTNERMRIASSGVVTFSNSTTHTGPATFSNTIIANSSAGTAGQVLTSSATGAYWATAVVGLVAINAYTTSQTITIPATATKAKIEIWGGGGGGGAGTVGPCAQPAAGSGGGGGGWLIKYLTSLTPGNTLQYTQGAAGTAAGAGGSSILASNTQTITTLTSAGGSAGAGTNGGASPSYSAGGAGGAATNGDINITGRAGSYGGGSASSAAAPPIGAGGTSGGGARGSGGFGVVNSSGTVGFAGGMIIEWFA